MTPRARRHAQLHLPPLDSESALALVNVLERAIAAVWRAHGDDMADRLAARGIETPPAPDCVTVGNPAAGDDVDF